MTINEKLKKATCLVLGFVMVCAIVTPWVVPVYKVQADGRVDGVGMTIAASGGNDPSSFAIQPDGGLWAWGRNNFGQLGNGTTTDTSTPVRILDNVVAVSAGHGYTMALRADGSLYTWGRNNFGQLGDGTATNRHNPARVLDNVTAISAGVSHAVAIRTDGSLWAWGDNRHGQLGDGTTTEVRLPIRIMENVTAIAAGSSCTMAIRTDGSLWAWGFNNFGQLGDGTTTDRHNPVRIMDNVTAVSAGLNFTMAIRGDGSLWGWGVNDISQLGDGTSINRLSPVRIMDNVTSVSAGSANAVAIRTDGSLWGWGHNNSLRFDSRVTVTLISEPINIMDNVVSVSVGSEHKLAILADGSLWARGRNHHGQIGNGGTGVRLVPEQIMGSVMRPTTPTQTTPTTPPTSPDVEDAVMEEAERPPTTPSPTQPTNRANTAAGGTIAAGGVSSFAIQQDGSLWAWGSYGSGVVGVGRGAVYGRLSPTRVLDNVTAISAGGSGAIATRSDGSFWTVQSTMPTRTGTRDRFPMSEETYNFVSLRNFLEIGSVDTIYEASGHTFIIRPDGSLWGFGYNSEGQLGDGTRQHRTAPVRIMDDVIAISNTSWSHTMAIRSDGSLWGWGVNTHGQLGDGTTTSRLSPMRIMDDVVAVSASSSHTAAIRSDGSLWTWGRNTEGRLGDGTTTNRHSPVRVMDDVVYVSVGGGRTMAIRTDGSLWGWGHNSSGTVGDGTTEHRHSPVKIMDDVVSVSAGGWHTLALRSDGSLWAWGENQDSENYTALHRRGMIGDGTNINRSSPVHIMDNVMLPPGVTASRTSGTVAGDTDLATASTWARNDITQAINLGLVPQTLQTNYTNNATRAEFSALAVALYETITGREITGRMQFNDTNDINVQKMGYLGIVTGVGNGNFAPNNGITREQAAVMIARLANELGQPIPSSAPTFADNNGISSWAFDAVGQMQSTGIMGGVGNNNFAPSGDYTREQSIITMLRLFDLLS